MSKNEVTKPTHSKHITEKHRITKNVVVRGGYAKNVSGKQPIAKPLSTTQLMGEHSISGRSVSKSDVGKDEESLIEQLDKALQIFVENTDFEDLYSSRKTKISFTNLLSNKLLLVMVIRKGIPYSIFTLIRHITPFSLNDWANYLDISSKSLIRYQKQDKPFKPSLTEKIIELAEVTNLGIEVFGNSEKFMVWLETPNYALGNLKPFDLLRDSYGKEMIIGELTRIEHGILA
jgi:putative toxin-antitoxin system antitoxin component (TIGR02293 family)